MLTVSKKKKMSFKAFAKIASEIPSVVLGMAIRDADYLGGRKGFTLDMTSWLRRKGIGECVCCLAGSCMLRTLGVRVPRVDDACTRDDAKEASAALHAIDLFRVGDIGRGLGVLNIEIPDGMPLNIPHGDDPWSVKASRDTARKTKAILEAFNL